MKRFIYLFLGVLCLTSCGDKGKILKVAATSVPHAEMLECIKPEMAKKGVNLEIVVVDDYNLPNRLLEEGEVDANFFQHLAFLEAQKKPHLVVLAAIHYEPLGVYSLKWPRLAEVPNGAIVSVPSDPTNEARALLFLETLQLLTLKKKAGFLTIRDIEKNPKNLHFEEIDPPLLTRTLEDVDIAVIPANFALMQSLKSPIAKEKSNDYQNVLVVRKGTENREDLQILAGLLTSEEMRSFLLSQYKGAVCPCF